MNKNGSTQEPTGFAYSPGNLHEDIVKYKQEDSKDAKEDKQEDTKEDKQEDMNTEKANHISKLNNDNKCIPNGVHKSKYKNCIPKDLTVQQAYDSCVSVSDSNQSCQLIHPTKKLSYQTQRCGDDYYCAIDQTDSCTNEKCSLNELNYSFGNQSICSCQAVPNDKSLEKGVGRMCIKNNNCSEYNSSYRKPKNPYNFPELTCFYDACEGPPSWMDVPNINNRLESKIYEGQIS
jgi:hypothetical protein